MDVKRLKTAWSFVFDRTGHYDRRLQKAANERRWFIPMYHRILREDELDPFNLGLGVSQRHFDQHLSFFKTHFHVCTVEEGLARHQADDWPDRPLLSITFDDGYLDNAELALPALQHHGCKATFFISTGAIDEQRPFWWDLVMASATRPEEPHWRSMLASLGKVPGPAIGEDLRHALAQLWDRPYGEITTLIDVDQACMKGLDQYCPAVMQKHHVKDLHDGGMEVAAHTHHHPNLTKESDETIEHELVCSKALIEDWTGRPVTGFATPHGYVDGRVKALCAEHGMTYIASTDRGSNQNPKPNHLQRFGVADAGLPTMKRSLINALN